MFAVNSSTWWIFLSAIIAGIGGSLFEPTGDAALTTLTTSATRSRTYAVKKVIDNVGIVISALIGSFLVRASFHSLSLVCGAVFVLAGVLTYIRLPAIHVQVKPVPVRQMWNTVSRDKTFVHYVAIMTGFFFMYMQLYLAIPARIVAITHQASSVSMVFFVLSFMMMIFQVPMNAWVSRFDLVRTVQTGLLLMGAGLLLLGLSRSVVVFIMGVILFACGIMSVEPASFDLTAKLSNPQMTATYFGFYYLAMAVGGGLSQGTGGLLLQVGISIGFPSLIWWLAALIAFIATLGAEPLGKTLRSRSLEKGVSHPAAE